MATKRLTFLSFILFILALGFLGCSEVAETVNPQPTTPGESGEGTTTEGGSGEPGDPGGGSGTVETSPTTGLFSVSLSGSECEPSLPQTVELEFESLSALTSDGQAVPPDPPISQLTVQVSCSEEGVTLTAPGTNLPAGQYVGLQVTITGVTVDGEPLPLPGGSVGVMVRVEFTVDADGTLSVELELNFEASFARRGTELDFNPVFVVKRVTKS